MAFNLTWSNDHLKIMEKIDRAVRGGGLFAFAMPRGSGKTTLARVAGLWAVVFGFRSYVCLIGSAEDQAKGLLESIRRDLLTNDLLLEDFPEVVYPIRRLENNARKQIGQLCCGEPTYITWSADRLVLPTLRGDQLPMSLRREGYEESPSAGAVITVAGLDSNIRGQHHTKLDGSRYDATMHRPPPLSHWHRFPATIGIAAAAIGVTLAGWSKLGFEPFVMDFRAWHGEPWRLLVSALPHLDLIHLVFNLNWVWVFGTIIERVLGWKALTAFAVLFAAISAATEYALFDGGVGLSGVVYGFFGLLWVLSRRDDRFRGLIDQQTILLLVVWFVLCCVLTAADIWRVGNAAHAGGFVAGAVVGLALSTKGSARFGATTGLIAMTAIALVAATAGRPYVNMGRPNADEAAFIAYGHLVANRDEEALAGFQRALEIDSSRGHSWYCLGTALHRLRRLDECVAAYEQAVAKEPSNSQYRSMALQMMAFLAAAKIEAGDHQSALRLYRKLLELNGSDATAWFNMGVAFQHLGELNNARQAYRQAVGLDEKNVQYRHALDRLSRNPN